MQTVLKVADYDLAATLACGQAFRWKQCEQGWEGVVGAHWVRLRQTPEGIEATVADAGPDWQWLAHYLQTNIDFAQVVNSFPVDKPMRCALGACRGLRLLRQDPWECLASFICSSTKQIVQIQQIIALLCERFGSPIGPPTLPRGRRACAFPTAERIAAASETELRACKMGFRAPNLLRAARMIVSGKPDLEGLRSLPVTEAREQLVRLPGVGRKIADCVLLFAYGFETAFPVDVWVQRGLRELYFPKRRPTARRIIEFSETYFGPHAGYAQQYLFHYMRTKRMNQRLNTASKIAPATAIAPPSNERRVGRSSSR